MKKCILINCRSELARYVNEIDGEAARLAYDQGRRVPHFLYELNAPTVPDHEIRTGKGIFGPAHHWIDKELLLKSQTIYEAYKLTRARDEMET